MSWGVTESTAIPLVVGACDCAPGFGNCDGNPANGCEVDLWGGVDLSGGTNHLCGACSVDATHPVVVCGAGTHCAAGACVPD